VFPPRSRAVRCAIVSAPMARPLTTVMSRSTSTSVTSRVHSRPCLEARREPTTATRGPYSSSIRSPRRYSSRGAARRTGSGSGPNSSSIPTAHGVSSVASLLPTKPLFNERVASTLHYPRAGNHVATPRAPSFSAFHDERTTENRGRNNG